MSKENERLREALKQVECKAGSLSLGISHSRLIEIALRVEKIASDALSVQLKEGTEWKPATIETEKDAVPFRQYQWDWEDTRRHIKNQKESGACSDNTFPQDYIQYRLYEKRINRLKAERDELKEELEAYRKFGTPEQIVAQAKTRNSRMEK